MKLSTAYHAQTNGNTKIMNQILQQRLRPFVNHYQDNWSELLPAMDFAAATNPHDSIGLSPAEVEMGFLPKMHYDWDNRTTDFGDASSVEKQNRLEAQQYAARMHEAWAFARTTLQKAQDRQTTQANKTRRPEDFDVGDRVYILKRAWRTDRPSDKLDNLAVGPYPIVAKIGHSWKVELPTRFKMHDVFHSDRLRKAATESMPGQLNTNDDTDFTIVDGEPEYDVDKILASRAYRRKLQYQVEWQGWDPDYTWYDAEGFKNSATLLRLYHQDNLDKPGPPLRLAQWQEAADRDAFDPPHPDDNKLAEDSPANPRMRTRRVRRG
jgi:hypothetical protein